LRNEHNSLSMRSETIQAGGWGPQACKLQSPNKS